MKKKLLFAAPTLMLAVSTVSASCLPKLELTPYIGADAQWRNTIFKQNFGKNIFKTNYPQGNIYAGVQFSDYLGVEGGFEGTSRVTRSNFISAGTVVLGVPALDEMVIAQSSFDGWHASVVGYLPIRNEWRCSLVGSVGFTSLRVKLNEITTPAGTAEVFPLAFAKRNSVLRLGAGIRHFFNDCMGFRAMVFWENTRKFKSVTTISPFPERILPETAKLKDSVIAGLGLFVQF